MAIYEPSDILINIKCPTVTVFFFFFFFLSNNAVLLITIVFKVLFREFKVN
jgi:hypothetical protein